MTVAEGKVFKIELTWNLMDLYLDKLGMNCRVENCALMYRKHKSKT
jgi:hypothetical protein